MKHIPDKIQCVFTVPLADRDRIVDQWRNPETDDEQAANELAVVQKGFFDISAGDAPNEIRIWMLNSIRLEFDLPEWWVVRYDGEVRQWWLGHGHYDIVYSSYERAAQDMEKFKRSRSRKLTIELADVQKYSECAIVLDGVLCRPIFTMHVDKGDSDAVQ